MRWTISNYRTGEYGNGVFVISRTQKGERIYFGKWKQNQSNSGSSNVDDGGVGVDSGSVRKKSKPKLSIEELRQMAKDRNGKCLSEEYSGTNTAVLWECHKGHQWQSRPYNIKYDNNWCPTCYHNDRRGKSSLLSHETVWEKLNSLGFDLQGKYENQFTPIIVKHIPCDHEFTTTYSFLAHKGVCPNCNSCPRQDREEIEALISFKEGKIIGLAEKSRSKSTWECVKGHQWRAPWSSVKNGSWCPVCAGKKSLSEKHKQATSKLYQHKRWDASKGYACDIEIDDLLFALSSLCTYCGNEASNFDRMDSNIGHVKSNVVPCCGRCNKVKNNLIPYEIMLDVGEVFKKHNI